jgi:hypothetical protein
MAIEATNGLTGDANRNPAYEYKPPAAQPVSVITAPAQDAVVLSVTAQATLLQQQGLSIGEIAQELGLDAKTVQADLGIAITQTRVAAA